MSNAEHLQAACSPGEHHGATLVRSRSPAAIARGAEMLRVAGDPARLRLLELLSAGEQCVSALAGQLGDPMPAVSQRLARLKASGLVTARRDGKHVHYALADGHVASLLLAVLDHADHRSEP
jgi:DNA-binding transcriptional ArsR family regulator